MPRPPPHHTHLLWLSLWHEPKDPFSFVLAQRLLHAMAVHALYFSFKPLREHEMTLYYEHGIHTFDSGPSWPERHMGLHGTNNFWPGRDRWTAELRFRGEEESFRYRVVFRKRDREYRTGFEMYVGKCVAIVHMRGNKVAGVVEHTPIDWCSVIVLDWDRVQSLKRIGTQKGKRSLSI